MELEEACAGMARGDVEAVLVVHGEIGGLAGRDFHLLAVNDELERPVVDRRAERASPRPEAG